MFLEEQIEAHFRNREDLALARQVDREAAEAERQRCDKIVCEEWHRAVADFGLNPGSRVETVIGRILDRIRETEAK